MRKLILAVLLLGGCQQVAVTTQEEGARFFADNCVACHGEQARGNGPMAAGLDTQVPDLTGLSARNGGTFPRNYVMSVIDGYQRGDHSSSVMPVFGEMDLGEIEITETADGRGTPVPRKLLALADYLERIQR